MNELAELTIKTHGGLKRWGQFESVSAHLDQGRALWALKGQAGTLDHTNVTAGLRSEWASHAPFDPSGARSRFEPHRVALESPEGEVVEELREPRASFAGHALETPWSTLQLAYFVGCAMWTYLNTPFLLAHPGVASEELSPWEENGETWRRLRVSYPGDIATHSSVQTLYIDGDGLLKRHDYDVEIAGNTPGAHFIDVAGIMFPTKRRIFPRQADGTASPEPLVVSIDLSDIALK